MEKFTVDGDVGEGLNARRFVNQESAQKMEKPKYDKNNFFDDISNSTLEAKPQRGRGGGNRGDYRGGRGNYTSEYRGRGERGNYRGRGRGNWDNNRGGGGYHNQRSDDWNQDWRQNKSSRKKYSDNLKDPNSIDYNKSSEEVKDDN